jgi:hypothetical protein
MRISVRILFFVDSVSRTRPFDRVLQSLAERGHTVVLATPRPRDRPLSLPKQLALTNHALVQAGRPGRIELATCPAHRLDRWQHLAPALRSARDYVRYYDPRYAGAARLERRAAAHAPSGWLALIQEHPWLSRNWRLVSRLLAMTEDAIPSDRLLDLFIAYERPDVVLVTPLVDFGSYQTECVKSAHRIGVPVVLVPFSWDDLTTRGLVRVEPDRVLAWNAIQQREAIELHGVSPSRVIVTGAPRFDELFGMRPSSTRDEFCAATGLASGAPFLLYACSSDFAAPGEVSFVPTWIERLRQSPDPAVRGCGILVRPHPEHAKAWRNTDLSMFPNVALWTDTDTLSGDRGLYESLLHSAALVGLNTGAILEAAILGKTALTPITGENAGDQERSLHFQSLRAANGGPLREAGTFGEHASQVAAVLRGDEAVDPAGPFVERFVRPRGLEADVAPVMVDEIERAARLRKRPARASLCHYPVRLGLRAGLLAGARGSEHGTAAPASDADGLAGETLVMTATFRAGTTPVLVIRREEDRIEQYLCALLSWARPQRIRRIVFAENSNTGFDFSPIVRLLEAAGKEVEVLVYDGNKGSEQLGKGFGEGEILEHVFRHSRLLRRGSTFYKVTGRLFVRNFDRVSESTPGRDAFRMKHRKDGKPSKVNTVFFKCSMELFERRLLKAYRQVDERKGVQIEHTYYNQLRDVDAGGFGAAPRIVGQQASTGLLYEPYDDDVIAAARSLLRPSPQHTATTG